MTGFGSGIMLTASVNVVQSSVSDADQGALSGVSRSVSNLGSSMGSALAGAVLVSALISGVTDKTNESTVLIPLPRRRKIAVALERDVSAVSDEQVERRHFRKNRRTWWTRSCGSTPRREIEPLDGR